MGLKSESFNAFSVFKMAAHDLPQVLLNLRNSDAGATLDVTKSEYDLEIPKSHNADQHDALWGRAKEHW